MFNLGEYDNEKFYNRDWFLWLTLIFFAPVGIFLLWKRRRFNTFARVALTAFFGIIFLSAYSIGGTRNMVAQNRADTNIQRVGWTTYSPRFSFSQWIRSWFASPQPTTRPPVPTIPPIPSTTIGPTNPSATPPTTVPTTPPTTVPTTPPTTMPTTPPTTTTPTTPPTAAPTQNPGNQPVGSNWKALQDKIFELTNVERQKNGVPLFVYNARVEKYAVEKSQDMAINNYFDHRSPTKGYFSDIWKRDGFMYSAGAENIYTASDSRGFANRDINSLAQSIVTGWMNSEGHRRNILNPKLRELGVGVAENNNKLYATQLFYTP